MKYGGATQLKGRHPAVELPWLPHLALQHYNFVLLLYSGLKAVFSRCADVAKDYLAWTIWKGDSMQEVCILHRIPRAWEQQGCYERGHYKGKKSQTRPNYGAPRSAVYNCLKWPSTACLIDETDPRSNETKRREEVGTCRTAESLKHRPTLLFVNVITTNNCIISYNIITKKRCIQHWKKKISKVNSTACLQKIILFGNYVLWALHRASNIRPF